MGPLEGLRVLQVSGHGPAPFCAMVLGDLGADVVRIDRTGYVPPAGSPRPRDVLARGARSVHLDLKDPAAVDTLLGLVDAADVLIEGFRPGVAERLGFGPDVCRARNPRLVYGRMTGWGQEGPMADAAGHDINYIALAGALEPIGRAGEPPTPPINLLGDFGGGGMLLAVGVLAALHERASSGEGQVVDAAMVDGAALLTAMLHGLRAMGVWFDERGTNVLDTGSPFYDVYETADGRYVAVGAVEPQFYALLLERMGLADEDLPAQLDRSRWGDTKARLAAVFRTRTRDQWCEVLEGTDACFAPVLSLGEATTHPHNVHRSTFVEIDGVVQPAPAPRFDRTPAGVPAPPAHAGEHTAEVLAEWGVTARESEPATHG